MQVYCTVDTPSFFKYVRGSSNAIIIKDETWFLCHIISNEDRRYYYHLLIVLDKKYFFYSSIILSLSEPSTPKTVFGLIFLQLETYRLETKQTISST